MFKENKWLIIGALITAVIIIGGVFYFSKNTPSVSTPNVVKDSILLPDDAYITGGINKDGAYLPKNENARVTLVEFGDFQCPSCAAYSPVVIRLLNDFESQINFSHRNYPLSQHKNAYPSAQAAEAAGLQGKFWEMHDVIYEKQNDWAVSSEPQSIFENYAKELGLNIDKFRQDYDSKSVKDRIQKDQSAGNQVNINATPTFFLNGVKMTKLPAGYEDFKSIIQNAIDNAPVPSDSPESAYHIHFDLKIYLNGVAVDLSQAKYQQSKDNPLDPDIHLHDGNGKVVHVHAKDISMRVLLDSLKINIPEGTASYVNGRKFDNISSYIPQDLDKILIGSSNLSSVSSDSCIYSLKCPERGTPPPEECVGGLGTDCAE